MWKKCLEDNKDILRSSYYKFTVPLNDFVYAYSKIADVARELRRLGDVIIVPEGPKPQILASSIVPRALGLDGITCFHVTRPRNQQTTVIEIDAARRRAGWIHVQADGNITCGANSYCSITTSSHLRLIGGFLPLLSAMYPIRWLPAISRMLEHGVDKCPVPGM